MNQQFLGTALQTLVEKIGIFFHVSYLIKHSDFDPNLQTLGMVSAIICVEYKATEMLAVRTAMLYV